MDWYYSDSELDVTDVKKREGQSVLLDGSSFEIPKFLQTEGEVFLYHILSLPKNFFDLGMYRGMKIHCLCESQLLYVTTPNMCLVLKKLSEGFSSSINKDDDDDDDHKNIKDEYEYVNIPIFILSLSKTVYPSNHPIHFRFDNYVSECYGNNRDSFLDIMDGSFCSPWDPTDEGMTSEYNMIKHVEMNRIGFTNVFRRPQKKAHNERELEDGFLSTKCYTMTNPRYSLGTSPCVSADIFDKPISVVHDIIAIELFHEDDIIEDVSFLYGQNQYIVTFDEFIKTSDPMIFFIPLPHSDVQTIGNVRDVLFIEHFEDDESIYIEKEHIGNRPNDLMIHVVYATLGAANISKHAILHVFTYDHDLILFYDE